MKNFPLFFIQQFFLYNEFFDWKINFVTSRLDCVYFIFMDMRKKKSLIYFPFQGQKTLKYYHYASNLQSCKQIICSPPPRNYFWKTGSPRVPTASGFQNVKSSFFFPDPNNGLKKYLRQPISVVSPRIQKIESQTIL